MQAACDRRSNAARRTRPLQTGLRPEPPRDRSAGTPSAPLRGRETRTCASWPVIQVATPKADASLPRHARGFPGEAFVWQDARREHAGGM